MFKFIVFRKCITYSVFGYFLIISSSCAHLRNSQKFDFKTKEKYYLGISTPSEFQTIVESILLYYGYIIESYDNNQTATTISTRWKIIEPNSNEVEKEILEIKTKLLIEGKIVPKSFSKTNGFDYECYIYLKNLAYINNQYIPLDKDSILFDEFHQIIDEIRSNFIYYE